MTILSSVLRQKPESFVLYLLTNLQTKAAYLTTHLRIYIVISGHYAIMINMDIMVFCIIFIVIVIIVLLMIRRISVYFTIKEVLRIE